MRPTDLIDRCQHVAVRIAHGEHCGVGRAKDRPRPRQRRSSLATKQIAYKPLAFPLYRTRPDGDFGQTVPVTRPDSSSRLSSSVGDSASRPHAYSTNLVGGAEHVNDFCRDLSGKATRQPRNWTRHVGIAAVRHSPLVLRRKPSRGWKYVHISAKLKGPPRAAHGNRRRDDSGCPDHAPTHPFLRLETPGTPLGCRLSVGKIRARAEWDLERVVVALPGGRAGRRLLERMVELAGERGAVFTPPRIVTVGHLPELLYEVKKPLAGKLAQELAWIEAIRRSPADRIERLIRVGPPTTIWPLGRSLAACSRALHTELAADRLDFADVERQGARWPISARPSAGRRLPRSNSIIWTRSMRWSCGIGRIARLFAIKHGECRTDRDIVLVGTVDMDRSLRAMLDPLADRVTALVFAPAGQHDAFDEHGRLVVERRRDARGRRARVDRRGRWAGRSGRCGGGTLAAWNDQLAADEVTLGAADEAVVPYLEQRLTEAGLTARFGPADRWPAAGRSCCWSCWPIIWIAGLWRAGGSGSASRRGQLAPRAGDARRLSDGRSISCFAMRCRPRSTTSGRPARPITASRWLRAGGSKNWSSRWPASRRAKTPSSTPSRRCKSRCPIGPRDRRPGGRNLWQSAARSHSPRPIGRFWKSARQ